MQCCAERPQVLLPYVQHAQGPVREILGRVLGEVANASMAFDLIQFLGDDLDELRAAAARAMSNVQPGLSFDSLAQLAEDPIWFVRLRAVVSLAQGNMLMIISGAFGIFRTDFVRVVGGYRTRAIGEDIDLVARMHRYLLDLGAKYRVSFVPDPVCWTEVPSDSTSLGRQRAR